LNEKIQNFENERKKILQQFSNDNQLLNDALTKFERKFLLEEKIKYVLASKASKIHFSRKFKTNAENNLLEKCIKDVSEYNMIESDEEFITYYYLVKTETYLQNINVCKGL
jgi:pantothenate kinase-related protein Tda10